MPWQEAAYRDEQQERGEARGGDDVAARDRHALVLLVLLAWLQLNWPTSEAADGLPMI